MAGFAYGITRLQHSDFAPGPRVTAIQADIPQDVKMDNDGILFNTYFNLSVNAARKADLVVWPETCCPYPWYSMASVATEAGVQKFADKMHAREREMAKLLEENQKTNVLIGLTCYELQLGKVWRYNSAVLFSPAGKDVARYDKMHLVPFGEYVPLGGIFPFLQAFTPYKDDYSCKPGEHYTRFPLQIGEKKYTFGCIICYEDSDPYLARQYVRSDPVDFLVNISNDGWFHGTEEHEQHLAICRFRAVECRRSIVRAVNMGISAIIDPDGVVTTPDDTWAESKGHYSNWKPGDKITTHTVTDRVKLDTRTSFYAETGDWLPAACWGILIVLDIISRFLRWKRSRGQKK